MTDERYVVIDEVHVWSPADVERMRALYDELAERVGARAVLTTADERVEHLVLYGEPIS